MSGGAFPEGLCTLQVNSPCHPSAKRCLLDTYLLLTAPFRGMLLTLRGGPESLAPKTRGVPVIPHGVSTFLHAACTAHGWAPPNPCQAAAECRSSGLLLAGLCAADRDTVEGFPWPGRPRGWAPLGSRSPGLPLAAAVLPAGRRRKVRCARSCVKARAARSPAPLGPRLDTRSLRVGFAA